VKRVAHVAFEVDDLQAAIKGQKVIVEPNSPSLGVVVAFIDVNGAPVELLQSNDPQGCVDRRAASHTINPYAALACPIYHRTQIVYGVNDSVRARAIATQLHGREYRRFVQCARAP
jgi:hypothetical protein